MEKATGFRLPTLMVYRDEKRGEVSGEDQAVIANEASNTSSRSEATRPTV